MSIYFQKVYEIQSNLVWISTLVLCIGMFFRGFSTEILFLKKPLAFRLMSIAGYFFMAIGWTLHLLVIFNHYGDTSKNVSYTMMVVTGIFIITSQALTSSKDSYYTFNTTLALGAAAVYLFDGNPNNNYIAWGFVGFTITYVRIYGIAHKQLRRTIELQILSDREKRRLQDLIDSVPAVILIMDKDYNYVGANTFAQQMFPHVLSQKVGYTSTEGYTQFIKNFMSSDKTDDVNEVSVNLPNGTRHMMVNTHKTSDGGAVIVALIMDELVKIREELKEQEAKAQYSSKLASLGQMAAGIAHEVNNPLTIIQGSANIINRLISETPVDVEAIKDFSDKMLQTCKRISKTIQSLKSLSRNGENDPFTAVPLKVLMEDCLNVCIQRFKSSEVELVLPELVDDLYVRGREVQLGQVLLNLLNNACDAAEGKTSPWVRINVSTSQEWVFVDVVDSGNGIPVEIRQKIMEPFFTTKEVNQGTGLGLSISKTIMSDHGGELILVENAPHTTFRMKILSVKKPTRQVPS